MSNEELIALIKKNPVGIGCGVMCLALAGGWYYRSGEVPAADQELQQKSAEAERLASNLKNAAQLKEQFDILVAANKEVDARLLRASQLGKNVQYFYKLESETGAKLVTDPRQTPAQSKSVGKASYVPIAFSVSLQGDLPHVLNFLRRLESGAHYCRVLSFTCSVPQERSQALSVNVNLEMLGLP